MSTMKKRSVFLSGIATVVIGVLTVGVGWSAEEPAWGEWQKLFNGADTEGWKNPYDRGIVTVKDGEIHLQADKKFFLVTERTFGDFEFEGEILMPEGKANSGIMFRCHVEKNKVFGYQAECDPSSRGWSGGLYDEGRRKWLNPKQDDKESERVFKEKAHGASKPGEWNTYRIRCIGDHLEIFVNGVQTTDFRDSMDAAGPIGIQHHGEKGKIYKFRNLRIRELQKERDAGGS